MNSKTDVHFNRFTDFSKLIHEIVVASGLSQIDVAEKLGVSEAYISHILRGRRKRFSLEVAHSIAELHARLMQDPKRKALVEAKRAAPSLKRA